MTRKTIAFLLPLVLLWTGLSWGRTLKVAVDATWPPMEYLDESGRIVGCDIDFMKAAGAEAGFEVTFENVPWSGIFEGLATGRYDAVCSSVAISEERKKIVDFSLPYFWDRNVRQALLVRQGSTLRTLADMKGRTVGAQAGTSGYAAVEKAGAPMAQSYDDIAVALRDLAEKRIDGVVCDDPVASALLLQRGDRSVRLEIASFPEAGVEYYGVAVKKGNREVLDLIDRGIEAVQAKGIDLQIRKKWMEK